MPLDHSRLDALLVDTRVAALLAALNGAGEETRIVGGAVRNALVGRHVHEVDLATTATPDETRARGEAAGFKVVPTGLAHGTLTLVVSGEPYEVTSLREDVETFGRHAVVRFGRDFAADALRRDFTINALSLDAEGRLHDYAGGLADLEAGRVRFIGDARKRIREDYLRILRFFRFSADFATGALDAEGLHAAIVEREGLAILSRERVRNEIVRLLEAKRAVEVVGTISDAGFLGLLLGGVADQGRLARAAAAGRDAVGRLAAALVRTREDADRLGETLRLSNAERARLASYARLVEHLHDAADPIDEAALRRLVADHPPVAAADALAALDGEPRLRVHDEARPALAGFEADPESIPVLPLRGRDLIAAGVPKGPAIGEAMARARARWLALGCPTGEGTREALITTALGGADHS
ncbi:CCA tRNA nucleotidyltransferase [Salinarimonas ramus]|uniref:Poly(A) polymerase n=1 Tax=Salinarimonas ramus TaxID=690164 RepID=A0A917Q8Z0_9HYPH|nr:CCA tRNA nucleotidyltransferase [Salinarimonas ramus]GGK37342.1 poly(A) polymerase [Salinarimonas ramus]